MKQQNTWVATFDGASCRVLSYDGAPRRLEEIVAERRTGTHKPHFDDRAGRLHSSVGRCATALIVQLVVAYPKA